MADHLYRAEITHTEKTAEQRYKNAVLCVRKAAHDPAGAYRLRPCCRRFPPGARRCCFYRRVAAGGPGLPGRRAGCHLLKLRAGSADRPLF